MSENYQICISYQMREVEIKEDNRLYDKVSHRAEFDTFESVSLQTLKDMIKTHNTD